MFESDADRLAMIQSLGGQVARVRGSEIWGIFDNDFTVLQDMVETTTPALTCRTSDVERLVIVKDDVLELGDAQWRVRQHQPDGTGMSVLVFRR